MSLLMNTDNPSPERIRELATVGGMPTMRRLLRALVLRRELRDDGSAVAGWLERQSGHLCHVEVAEVVGRAEESRVTQPAHSPRRPTEPLAREDLLAWMEHFRPEVVVYPTLDDLRFGADPVVWTIGRWVPVRWVLVGVDSATPSSEQRLRIRELLFAAGMHWPGSDEPDEPLLGCGPAGLRWVVNGVAAATAISDCQVPGAATPVFLGL